MGLQRQGAAKAHTPLQRGSFHRGPGGGVPSESRGGSEGKGSSRRRGLGRARDQRRRRAPGSSLQGRTWPEVRGRRDRDRGAPGGFGGGSAGPSRHYFPTASALRPIPPEDLGGRSQGGAHLSREPGFPSGSSR